MEMVAIRWYTGRDAKPHLGNVCESDRYAKFLYLYVYLVDEEEIRHYGSDRLLVHRSDVEWCEF